MPADMPTALGKEIGHRLRRRRVEAGLNASELCQRLGWTNTKTSRIETGHRPASDDEIVMYLASCGARQAEVDNVLALASQRGRYRSIEHGATSHLAFHEQCALTIESYEPTFVPVLLQTEAYANALLTKDGNYIAGAAELRLENLKIRQAILNNYHQPDYTWYIHENLLNTPVGNDLTMNEQLLHLTFLSAWSRCTIRIVPRSSKVASLPRTGFQRLTFTDVAPLVTLDLETNTLILDHPDDTDHYQAVLDRLDRLSLDPDKSRDILAEKADKFDSRGEVASLSGPQPATVTNEPVAC